MKYKQCVFMFGESETVAWIPEWAAHIGNLVQLKDSEDPKRFWVVKKVGTQELEEHQVRDMRHNHKEFQGSLKGGGIDEH